MISTENSMFVRLSLGTLPKSMNVQEIMDEGSEQVVGHPLEGKALVALFKSDTYQQILACKGKADKVFRTKTAAFERPFHVVMNTNIQRLIDEIRPMQDRIADLCAILDGQWAGIVEQAKSDLGPLFDGSKYAFKPSERIGELKLTFSPLAQDDWRTSLSDEEKAAIAEPMLREQERKLKDAQDGLKQALVRDLEDCARTLRSYTGKRAGSYKSTKITNIVENCERVLACNFSEDGELERTVRAIVGTFKSVDIENTRKDEYYRSTVAYEADKAVAAIAALDGKQTFQGLAFNKKANNPWMNLVK